MHTYTPLLLSSMCLMKTPARHSAALTLLIIGSLFLSGCTTSQGDDGEIEPPVINAGRAAPGEATASIEKAVADGGSKQEEGEIPLGNRSRVAAIHNLIAEIGRASCRERVWR